MGSASLAAAGPTARPPARTVTTIPLQPGEYWILHYIDVIMTTMASQITNLMVVYSHSGADQRKHQSSASLAFVRGIHRDRWIPCTKGQLQGKCFHLMTSSCECNLSIPQILVPILIVIQPQPRPDCHTTPASCTGHMGVTIIPIHHGLDISLPHEHFLCVL